MKLTAVQERALRGLVNCDIGPASLSNHVWPDHVALRKGMAPGTGLVRPMLAVLARLKKAGLVRWYSHRGAPVIWTLTRAGMEAIDVPAGMRVAILLRSGG